MAQAQVDLTKADPVEFSMKDEPWVKYKLEDGTSLFGRLIITKIFRGTDYNHKPRDRIENPKDYTASSNESDSLRLILSRARKKIEITIRIMPKDICPISWGEGQEAEKDWGQQIVIWTS